MGDEAPSSPEEFFAGHPLGLEVYEWVRSVLRMMGSFKVRVSKSQVAFRRRRGFAYLWLPGQYLSAPSAEVVLSIALGRHDPSRRFKEVAHPARHQWMHHLEVRDVDELDRDVGAVVARGIRPSSLTSEMPTRAVLAPAVVHAGRTEAEGTL